MIRTLPRPHPDHPKQLKIERLPKRKAMTLVAAFRARKGGILLCSDRKEDDGYGQKEIDKIYYIQPLMACQIYIAGSGPSEIIKKANEKIHQSFLLAEKDNKNVLAEHCSIIESSLQEIYNQYPDVLRCVNSFV
jgi:hypothetical protein